MASIMQMPDKPGTLLEWIDSDLLNWLGLLLIAEFALAVLGNCLV